MIHRLCDFSDLNETAHREVLSSFHQTDDLGELLEVISLRSPQLVLNEERDNDIPQIAESRHDIPEEILPMIVVPAIHMDLSTSKKTNEVFKNILTGGRLTTTRGLHLPTNRHAAVPIDGAAKTAFPIDETYSPSAAIGSFLLIVRTSHIVTAVHSQTIHNGCITGFLNDE